MQSAKSGRHGLSRSTTFLIWTAIIGTDLSGFSFFTSRGLSNLYGDGIAHVEGARRIFDSLSPGYHQIGTVWLPLFHLLAAPLAISDTLWRSGLAGSLVSAVAFALAAWFVFRLACEINRNVAAGLLALAGFLLSVNLLYLASAPMTEVLSILWAVLMVLFLVRFQQSGRTRTLIAAAGVALLGTLTRYDAWYLLPFATPFVFLASRDAWKNRFWKAMLFGLIAAAGPVAWILHNAYRFHDPFAFYNGPGSAKAIYAHQLATTGFRYPTDGSLWISAHYYIEDLKLVAGPWSLMLAVLGAVVLLLDRKEWRQRAAALLLVAPLPFYIQSLAYSGVALYVPTLFPHSYYNLRYGVEMAPALAVFPSFLVSARLSPERRAGLLVMFMIVLAGQWIGAVWPGVRRIPVVAEAIANTPCKAEAQQDTIRFLRSHYKGGRVLLDADEWLCVMPQVGIPYRDIVEPRDLNRVQRLAAATRNDDVRWIVTESGDAVDQLMRSFPAAFADFKLEDRQSLAEGSYVEIWRRPSL
jgi:hypothetical protein